jgi:hypothetical protein
MPCEIEVTLPKLFFAGGTIPSAGSGPIDGSLPAACDPGACADRGRLCDVASDGSSLQVTGGRMGGIARYSLAAANPRSRRSTLWARPAGSA